MPWMESPISCKKAHATSRMATACARPMATYEVLSVAFFFMLMAMWLMYITGMHKRCDPTRHANDHCTMAVGTVGDTEARMLANRSGVVMVYSMFCTESVSISLCQAYSAGSVQGSNAMTMLSGQARATKTLHVAVALACTCMISL